MFFADSLRLPVVNDVGFAVLFPAIGFVWHKGFEVACHHENYRRSVPIQLLIAVERDTLADSRFVYVVDGLQYVLSNELVNILPGLSQKTTLPNTRVDESPA